MVGLGVGSVGAGVGVVSVGAGVGAVSVGVGVGAGVGHGHLLPVEPSEAPRRKHHRYGASWDRAVESAARLTWAALSVSDWALAVIAGPEAAAKLSTNTVAAPLAMLFMRVVKGRPDVSLASVGRIY